jgi:predicted permease
MDFYLRSEKALRQIPGIESIAISDSLPPDADSWHDARGISEMLVGDQATLNTGMTGKAVLRRVTPAYFHVLGIPIVKGRGFTEEERTASGYPIILSQLLASRLFSQNDPIGKEIRFATFKPYLTFDSPTFTVVGVAANVKNAGLAGQDDPEYYSLRRDHSEDWSGHNVLVLETALPTSVLAPWIRAQIARFDATAPIELEPLSQSVRKLADRPRFEAALLSFFASSGLIMAIVGLYGVIAFIAIQRTQEIGVRMALGATRPDILRLIAGEGIRLILLGGALGLVAAFALARLLKGLLFGLKPHDPATYLTVTLLLAVVALAATLIPARSAMKVEPVEALRHE